MDLSDFIRESNRIEGLLYDPKSHEVDAHQRLIGLARVTVHDMEEFVHEVARAPLRTMVGMNVCVGHHVAPPGGPDVEDALAKLLKRSTTEGAYQIHCEYETLHPFMDGNGRSGRALWLWMMGGDAPLGFLHHFYYQTLEASEQRGE